MQKLPVYMIIDASLAADRECLVGSYSTLLEAELELQKMVDADVGVFHKRGLEFHAPFRVVKIKKLIMPADVAKSLVSA